jgi:hypothetical protein
MNMCYIDGDGQKANKKLSLPITIRYAPFHGIITCHRCKEGKKDTNIFFFGVSKFIEFQTNTMFHIINVGEKCNCSLLLKVTD